MQVKKERDAPHVSGTEKADGGRGGGGCTGDGGGVQAYLWQRWQSCLWLKLQPLG